MLERFLPRVKDANDLTSILTILRGEGTVTGKELERLLPLYRKYLGDAAQEEIRIGLLIDALPMLGEDHSALPALDLSEKDLETVHKTISWVRDPDGEMTEENRASARSRMAEEDVEPVLRTMMARAELNVMAARGDYLDHQEDIKALADFLTGQTETTLESAQTLLEEVWVKWRKRAE